MRVVDLSHNRVIKAGMPWVFSGSPNSKNMICNLERNESLITWFQPNGGKITDQFPAIRIQEQYYTLSLRQMKAVWRCVPRASRLPFEPSNAPAGTFGSRKTL